MVITDSALMQTSFEGALRQALEGGARLIQLREKQMAPQEVLALAQQAKQLCDEHGAKLLINSHIETDMVAGSGLHLPEFRSVARARETFGAQTLIGQSVHSQEAAKQAEREGADYLLFGSIFPTASHPDSTPASIEALHEISSQISIPVFAVGGITAQNAKVCLEAGAHGVAVIRAVWSAPDVAEAVHELVKVLHSSA